MKISRKLIAIVLVSIGLVSIVYLFPSGFFDLVADGSDGASKSIGESKMRGVFIAEYYSPQDVQVINDSIKVHVKEAWLEQKWYYKLFSTGRSDEEWCQLCMVVDEQGIPNYGDAWTIGAYTGKPEEKMFKCFSANTGRPVTPYLKCVGKSFGNREVFDVVHWRSEKLGDVEKIGEFVLLKKE